MKAFIAMDLVFILGEANSGKSSLIRCLSGLSRDSFKHPSPENVRPYRWGAAGDHKTLVLIGSLNEKSPLDQPRGLALDKYHHDNVHAADLPDILDLYYRHYGISKAIFSISLRTAKRGWSAQDYVQHFPNSQCVAFPPVTPGAQKQLARVPPQIHFLPVRPHPINDVARDCRIHIGFT